MRARFTAAMYGGGIAAALLLLAMLVIPRSRAAVRRPTAAALTAAVHDIESLHGSIVLAGGRFVEPIGEEFVRLAGGASARLVIIPTAYGPAEEEGLDQFRAEWLQRGAADVTVLHTRDRNLACDPAFVAPLRDATGVWFTGGNQSRLLDAYAGTLVPREVRHVLKRGGCVGGNCAGAAALGEIVIAKGKPTRPGFRIVPKLVADAHFFERNRIERLSEAIEARPDCFGMGIDGETAVVLKRGNLRVIGNSYVATMATSAETQETQFDVWAPDDSLEVKSLFDLANQ